MEEEEEGRKVVTLKAIDATPITFKEYGQVVEASPDGDGFGPHDAQLDLSQGTPRSVSSSQFKLYVLQFDSLLRYGVQAQQLNKKIFETIYFHALKSSSKLTAKEGPYEAVLLARFYIMHLEKRPLKFSTITHHASVTQCLGSIGGHVWYLGVAKPSIVVDSSAIKGDTCNKIAQSPSGHSYVPPAIEDVQVFKVAGSKFLKLNRGTWHAGPLFKADTMDFYNLELSNTNVIDRTTHNFKDNGVVFLIDEYYCGS